MSHEALARSLGFDPEALKAIRPKLQAFVDRDELAGMVALASRNGQVLQSRCARTASSASPR